MNEQFDKLPYFFMFPQSSFRAIPEADQSLIVPYRHPATTNPGNPLGLRIFRMRPGDLSIPAILARSKIVQSGDVVLTLRPEWAFAGSYPSVQMGVSHTGVAWLDARSGAIRNADNPLNSEYLLPDSDADFSDANHYKSTHTRMFHVLRHRGIAEGSREQSNIREWARMIVEQAPRVYRGGLSFNRDYMKSNFSADPEYTFVKYLGQMALGSTPDKDIAEYCSEFAWTLLSLRNCDPADAAVAAQFNRRGANRPDCIAPPFAPMPFLGTALTDARGAPGLADGPMLILATQKPAGPGDESAAAMVEQIFKEDAGGLSNMSEGHRAVASQMKDQFDRLRDVFMGILRNTDITTERDAFNRRIPANYSPTSFIIQSLLGTDSRYRTFDYVATLVYVE